MDEQTLRELIEGIRAGTTNPDDAVERLRRLPFADVDGALVAHHRTLRQGMPEAVYGPGKTVEHCVKIVAELLEHGSGPVLLTRTDSDQRAACLDAHGPAIEANGSLLWRAAEPTRTSDVLVITAGTSDLAVAHEAELTLRAYGFAPRLIADVGVAGLHRLLARIDDVTSADAIICVAGMEGALASVIGGLTAVPVVAVPTSVAVRRRSRRCHRAVGNARLVRVGRHGRRDRQRVRRRLRNCQDVFVTRTAWFNCHAGVAGDMVMAALVDAGADTDTIADTIAGLGVDGYAMFFERVQRCGVGATLGKHRHARRAART